MRQAREALVREVGGLRRDMEEKAIRWSIAYVHDLYCRSMKYVYYMHYVHHTHIKPCV